MAKAAPKITLKTHIKKRNELLKKFKAGKKPTEEDFVDLISAFALELTLDDMVTALNDAMTQRDKTLATDVAAKLTAAVRTLNTAITDGDRGKALASDVAAKLTAAVQTLNTAISDGDRGKALAADVAKLVSAARNNDVTTISLGNGEQNAKTKLTSRWVGIFCTPDGTANLQIGWQGGLHYFKMFRKFDAENGIGKIAFSQPRTVTHNLSIHAVNGVGAAAFLATSDRRIKQTVGRSDIGLDLATLLSLEVTDYRYIDVVAKGGGEHKKLIAQQVQSVYPQAVSQLTDAVPDIYQQAKIRDGWVQLPTDLVVGERVRIMTEGAADVYDVLEVEEQRFRTSFEPEGEQDVFVYGREVDDFLNVDYDAISMLNVSATQELHRQLEQQADQIAIRDAAVAGLEQRVSELEAKDAAREKRLIALESLLGDRSAAGGLELVDDRPAMAVGSKSR